MVAWLPIAACVLVVLVGGAIVALVAIELWLIRQTR